MSPIFGVLVDFNLRYTCKHAGTFYFGERERERERGQTSRGPTWGNTFEVLAVVVYGHDCPGRYCGQLAIQLCLQPDVVLEVVTFDPLCDPHHLVGSVGELEGHLGGAVKHSAWWVGGERDSDCS